MWYINILLFHLLIQYICCKSAALDLRTKKADIQTGIEEKVDPNLTADIKKNLEVKAKEKRSTEEGLNLSFLDTVLIAVGVRLDTLDQRVINQDFQDVADLYWSFYCDYYITSQIPIECSYAFPNSIDNFPTEGFVSISHLSFPVPNIMCFMTNEDKVVGLVIANSMFDYLTHKFPVKPTETFPVNDLRLVRDNFQFSIHFGTKKKYLVFDLTKSLKALVKLHFAVDDSKSTVLSTTENDDNPSSYELKIIANDEECFFYCKRCAKSDTFNSNARNAVRLVGSSVFKHVVLQVRFSTKFRWTRSCRSAASPPKKPKSRPASETIQQNFKKWLSKNTADPQSMQLTVTDFPLRKQSSDVVHLIYVEFHETVLKRGDYWGPVKFVFSVTNVSNNLVQDRHYKIVFMHYKVPLSGLLKTKKWVVFNPPVFVNSNQEIPFGDLKLTIPYKPITLATLRRHSATV